MQFYDNHTHTHFSPDSRMNLAQALEGAVQAGIAGISITDHLDIDAPDGKDIFKFNPLEQQQAIDELAGNYTCLERSDSLASQKGTGDYASLKGSGDCTSLKDSGDCTSLKGSGDCTSLKGSGNCTSLKGSGGCASLEIFKGIEVGLQMECMQKIKDFTKQYSFDIVIASTHFIDQVDPYFGEYYIGKTAEQAYGHAFEVMYNAIVEYNDFDVLGHYDYIARYAPYEVRDIKYSRFADALDPILKFLAQEGKALEINTNTYRERKGYTPQLDIDVVKRFRELGGEAISFGSDAHEAWRVAENFELYRQIIKNCGFNHLVYYKQRQPQFYAI